MTKKRQKIEYVSLESKAFLMDPDFNRMTAAERGVYCTLIFYLYCNQGKCRYDSPTFARLTNTEQFEEIWSNIKHKFQIRDGLLTHKRVTKELRRARQLMQSKAKAGLMGAQKRWHSQSTAIAKGRERNENVKENINTTNSNTDYQSCSAPTTVRSRELLFHDSLVNTLHPRTQSDRTCFRNITKWLSEGCATGRFNEQIFDRILGYAKEATSGRNPPAVFMALLKKELGYRAQNLPP